MLMLTGSGIVMLMIIGAIIRALFREVPQYMAKAQEDAATTLAQVQAELLERLGESRYQVFRQYCGALLQGRETTPHEDQEFERIFLETQETEKDERGEYLVKTVMALARELNVAP